MSKKGTGTIVVQGASRPNSGESSVKPLVQSTTFLYDTPEELGDLFDLKQVGPIYTRIGNPTQQDLEETLNALEGGAGFALATASGSAAVTIAFLNILSAGDHFVASSELYGGTYNLFVHTFKKYGIEVTFVDPDATVEEINAAFQPNTKALYGETLSNPGLNILDFDKFASIAKEQDVPFIVDNTLGTPHLVKPFEHGANIILHSITKYADGHGRALGGVIIDGGNYNWNNGKFPDLVNPDPSYHGISYTESFGAIAYAVKARVQLMRDIGAAISPFNAWLISLGLETLHLRIERHSKNALELAKYLQTHDKVEWVRYPGLKEDKEYAKGQKYLPKGQSGILTFGVKGGVEVAKNIITKFEIVRHVAHIGDARTLIIHPASTTHRQMTTEEQLAAGINPELIRISVGIEDVNDIIADFDQALAQV